MSTRGNRGAVLAPDAERLAEMLKALGNPIRFQIMQTLAERRTCPPEPRRGDGGSRSPPRALW